jgi:hypothetical protein
LNLEMPLIDCESEPSIKNLHIVLPRNLSLLISNDGKVDSGRYTRDPLFMIFNGAHRESDQLCVTFIEFTLFLGEGYDF